MENWEFPLWELFSLLQKAKFPLGIGEYKLLIEALSQLEEEEIKDSETLKRLCCALWVKSSSDELRFEAYFQQIFSDDNRGGDEKIVVPPQGSILQQIRTSLYRLLRGKNIALILGILSLLGLGTWGVIKNIESHQKLDSSIESPITNETSPKLPTPPSTTNESKPSQDPKMPIAPPKEEIYHRPLYILLFLFLGSSGMGYWVWLLIQQRKKKTSLLSKSSQMIAILPTQLTPDYFPITSRQMKQIWRQARSLVRAGPPTELDVKATVSEISRQGFLLNPVLIPRRVNRTQLLLLLDVSGSMVPFQTLSYQLAQTAYESGRFHQTWVYYFCNYPGQYLYQDSHCLQGQPIEAILPQLHPNYAGVLVVSDGGAIRGNFNPVRLRRTQEFIAELKRYTDKLSWLNPLPPHRWHKTTAGAIAKEIPMFELNQTGFEAALLAWRRR